MSVPEYTVPDLPTVLAFEGPQGEYISQGRQWEYMPANSAISVTATYDGVSQGCSGTKNPGGYIYTTVDGNRWDMEIAAPDGHALAPGTYSRVKRYPYCDGSSGGFDLWGARGCNLLTADFTIRELDIAPDGMVRHLDVRFDQYCENGTLPLWGALRYNATGPANP